MMYSMVQITRLAEDADGHVALRVLGLLRGGGDGIEADVGEEDDARRPEHAAPAELAEVRRCSAE